MQGSIPRVDFPLASESTCRSKSDSPLAAPRVAKSFPCLSMGSGVHKERATIFCMCAIFDNASPYTRSKFSNNHRLYRDTMPLISRLYYMIMCTMWKITACVYYCHAEAIQFV